MSEGRRRSSYLLLCFAVSFGAMFDGGYTITYVNTAEANFKLLVNESWVHYFDPDGLSDTGFSWAWSVLLQIFFLGVIISNGLLPLVTEKLGRVRTLSVGSLLAAIGSSLTLIAVIYDFLLLMFFGRLLNGLAFGLLMGALTLFLQETSPTALRGLASAMQELAFIPANTIGLIMGVNEVLGERLPLLVILGAFLDIGLTAGSFLMPETPKFLFVHHSDRNKAKKSLKFYQGEEANFDHFSTVMTEEIEQEKSSKVGLSTIFRIPYLRKALFIGAAALAAQNTTGVYAMAMFCTIFFKNVGLTDFQAQMGTVAYGLVNIVFTCVGTWLVERVGRRRLLLTTLGLICSCHILYVTLALTYNLVSDPSPYLGGGCIAVAFLYIILFSLGPGPIPWFIVSELVPQHARASAQGFCMLVGNTTALLITLLTLPLYEALGSGSYGPVAFLVLFVGPTALLGLFLYRNLPETRNREIPDIVRELAGGVPLQEMEHMQEQLLH